MKHLLVFFLIIIFCNPVLSQNYQNIPKGYEPFFLVSSPDSSKSVRDILWLHENNNQNLFIRFGYSYNSLILWLDTHTWEIKKTIHLDKNVDRFYGVTQDHKTLVMQKRKGFWIGLTPFFQKTEFILIDLQSEESKVISEKKFLKMIEKYGKLHGGINSFIMRDNILSWDKNILIVEHLYDFEDFFLKSHELAIFKYVGHRNYMRGLCNYNNLYAVNGFYEDSHKTIKEYPAPDIPPQFPKIEDHYGVHELFYNKPLFDKKAKDVSFDVKIAFTINCNGQMDSFFVISQYSSFFLHSLAHQVLDIVREMHNNWTPAKKNGQNVDCIQVLNVSVVNGKINKITHE
ncbi:hypothetical protein AD998_10640 [bacterium 336/3]|nr:hypothetical protein AD998_10640 [bacterium 336/3]